MDNTLPKYKILGLSFDVDVRKDQLRQSDRPDNIIDLSKTRYHQNHYYFNFYPKSGAVTGMPGEKPLYIRTPPLARLDPHGMSVTYQKTLRQMEDMTDIEIIIDPLAYTARILGGRKPVVLLEDKQFTVDLEQDKLWPGRAMLEANAIDLWSLDTRYLSEDKRFFRFPYDPANHRAVMLDPDVIFSIPDKLIAVEIPARPWLDPYHYSQHNGIDPAHHLRFHPPVMTRTARQMTWEEFGLTAQIERNRLRMQAVLQSKRRTIDDHEKQQYRRLS